MFLKWWNLNPEHRLRVWKLYGWFTALMSVGSVILAISMTAWTGFLVNFYPSDPSPDRITSQTHAEKVAGNLFLARVSTLDLYLHVKPPQLSLSIHSIPQAYRWLVAYVIFSPLSLGCLLMAKLLVIHRFANFLDPRMQHTPRRLVLIGRAVMGFIAAGCTIGFCCNVAAAVFFTRSSALYEDVASSPPELYNKTSLMAIAQVTTGLDIAAVFLAFESIALLLIVVVLVFVGTLGARSVNAALKAVESNRSLPLPSLKSNTTGFDESADRQLQRAVDISRRLKRQILGTVVVVLVSFVMRATTSVMFSTANAFQSSSDVCENYVGRCSQCYNDFSHMLIWFVYTPSFQLTVMLISQPVALIVSLWGMTSGHTLEILRLQKQERLLNSHN